MKLKMNYKLCICNNKNISAVDLSKAGLDNKKIYDLAYIDSETMKYSNEKELKEYLVRMQLITKEDCFHQIFIVYGNKNKRYIPVIYDKDKKTFDNLKNFASDIESYYNKKRDESYYKISYQLIMGDYEGIVASFPSFEVFAKNHKFLRAIQIYCEKNPKQNLNISDINIYLNQLCGDTKSKVIYIALYEMFRRIFFNHDVKTNELVFSYKSFRDFCVFYCDYKKNMNLEKESNGDKNTKKVDNLEYQIELPIKNQKIKKLDKNKNY